MHDVLVLCQELEKNDVDSYRSSRCDAPVIVDLHDDPALDASPAASPSLKAVGTAHDGAQDLAAPADESLAIAVAVAGEHGAAAAAPPLPPPALPPPELSFAALEWATGIKDNGILVGLVATLPAWALEERIRLYEARREPADIKPKGTAPLGKITVTFPCSVPVRLAVSKAYDEYLRCHGKTTISWGITRDFIAKHLNLPRTMYKVSRTIIRWHRAYLREGKSLSEIGFDKHARKPRLGKHTLTRLSQRKRWYGGGRPPRIDIVRQHLYEWFICVRYSIDWKKFGQPQRSCGGIKRRKCQARFPRSILKTKASQLVQEYAHECLVNGVTPQPVVLTYQWFKRFERDFNLSLRTPNRKFKVPKAVLAERLEEWWRIIFRLRTLALEVLGYDLEMENWDQSPYYRNESGSSNTGTIDMSGLNEVTLIEGHADTRDRWSFNAMTWSNVERILEEGPPYCECMFRGGDGKLEKQLKDHVRSCGYDKWMSAAVSPKGSYRECDVLSFLDTHLPLMHEGRRWRIALADDLASHKTEAVFRLCFSRGYILVIHGGGATPVTQTVDTDCNQHLRRGYTATEVAEFIRQMQLGTVVPKTTPEDCIDMMAAVAANLAIHVAAADGYKKTGATVELHGDEDHLIVREAGIFWKKMGMRAKINDEIAHVTEEVSQKRLTWSEADIRSLITPYRKRADVDRDLAALGDDTWVQEEGGQDGYCGKSPCQSDVDSAEHDDEEKDAESDMEDELEGQSEGEAAAETPYAVAGESASLSRRQEDHNYSEMQEAEADLLCDSEQLLAGYKKALEILKDVGAVSSVSNLKNEIRKTERRQRSMCKESTAVAVALARRRDAEHALLEDQRRLVADQNRTSRTAAALKKTITDANNTLKTKREEIAQQENILEAKHMVKNFTPVLLGHGKPKGGGLACRKRRFEVLDRLARMGSGLAAGQRNNWMFFKETWDERMLLEHKEKWGILFAELMQKVINDSQSGISNAFSLFVERETQRCLAATPVLLCP